MGHSKEPSMHPFLIMVLTGYAVFMLTVAYGQIACAGAKSNGRKDT